MHPKNIGSRTDQRGSMHPKKSATLGVSSLSHRSRLRADKPPYERRFAIVEWRLR